MCRLVAYLGERALLKHVVVDPPNSIVKQSLHAKESHYPTNGDGFGLGWYAPEISPTPALFTSILPAWNDRNLLNLAAKIQSPAFFAHVRAASSGGVSQNNCHPFVHEQWMLMHNGNIHRFPIIKRHLRRLLDDDIYDWIKGETDSEHLFALFLHLSKGYDLTNLHVVADRLIATFHEIEQLLQDYHATGPSYYNICLTDGKHIIACRYCTDPHKKPESMHYAQSNARVLVSSEQLTNVASEWQEVPKNHLILIDKSLQVTLLPIAA